MTHRTIRIGCFGTAAAAMLAAASWAGAGTYIWTGGNTTGSPTNLWTQGGNWEGGAPPPSGTFLSPNDFDFSGTTQQTSVLDAYYFYVNQLTFSSGGFTIQGADPTDALEFSGNNPTITSNGSAGTTNTVSASTIFNADGATLTSNGGTLLINGQFHTALLYDSATNTTLRAGLTVTGAGNTTIEANSNNAIGAFTKNGTGTLTLNFSNGLTAQQNSATVNQGILVLQNVEAIGNPYYGTPDVTVNSGGQLQLAGSGYQLNIDLAGTGPGDQGAMRITSGAATVDAGGISLSADASLQVDAGASFFTSTQTQLNGHTLTLQGAGNVSLSQPFNNGALVMNGTGVATVDFLPATVTIANGTLKSYMGADTSNITIGGATTAGILENTDTHNIGTGSTYNIGAGGGTILNDGGNMQFSAIIQGNGHALTFDGAGSYQLNGGISGNGTSVTKNGAGTLQYAFGSSNTYTGVTTVNQGMLQIQSGAGPAQSTIYLANAAGASMDLNAYYMDFTIGALAGGGDQGGNVTSVPYFGGILHTGGNNQSTTYAGVISGVIGLDKQGTGTFTLSGDNTYTGDTSVSAGRLNVDGSIDSEMVSVASGAALGGSGHVNAIGGAGTVAPGDAPGILTATQADTSDGMDFAFEMTSPGDPNFADSANSGNAVLRLTDASPFTAALTDDNGVSLFLNVPILHHGDSFSGGFFSTDANLLDDVSNGMYAFYLPDVSGSTTFNGLHYTMLDSGDFSLDVENITADFADGDVNGYLTQFLYSGVDRESSVPEPAEGALALLGLAGLLIKRRRA